MRDQSTYKGFLWISLFSIAMGFLETAVVIYLRALYYPDGFQFPLVPIEANILWTELLREAATLIMLVGIGIIRGRTPLERFAWFIYSFAIWDIFYYVFLKLLLDWPESLLTWDILFLIPITWTGPVIAPVILSLTMILLALSILHFNKPGLKAGLNKIEWTALIIGSLITIVAFCWDYSSFMLTHYSIGEMWPGEKAIFDHAISYIPRQFNWWLFLLGELTILIPIFTYIRRNGFP